MAFKCKQKNQAFNIIDKDDLFKIDIFFLGNDKFSQCEMKRKITYTLSDDPSESIVVCSPEDIIIHKLYWYQLGDGVSDRQWNDVMNVIKIQKQNLDFEYLKSAAENKGVSDLLEKALKKRR